MCTGQILWNIRLDHFFKCDVVAVGMYLSSSILGRDLPRTTDIVLQALTLEHVGLRGVLHIAASKLLKLCTGVKPSEITAAVEQQAGAPLAYVSCQMRMQRMLMRYNLDFSHELGQTGQARLRQQFERYCWVFTDTLIDRWSQLFLCVSTVTFLQCNSRLRACIRLTSCAVSSSEMHTQPLI
jgi:hypothetical protein